MGREEFGRSIGMSGSTAWFWLQQFKDDSMIDIKTSNKGSILTIKNWEEYQRVDSEVDSGKTAEKQRMNRNKNDKNGKNDKKTYAVREETKSLYEYIQQMCEQYSLNNKVNIKSLDLQVERHLSTGIHLRVEVRKCLGWLIDKDKKDVSSQRLTNWFEKAKDIQTREKLKMMASEKDGKSMKDIDLSVSHFSSSPFSDG